MCEQRVPLCVTREGHCGGPHRAPMCDEIGPLFVTRVGHNV